jgi:hypothetical protein
VAPCRRFLEINLTKIESSKIMATITTIKSYRLDTSFTRSNGTVVCNLSLDVEDALFNNPAFTKPPVPVANMITNRLALTAAMVEARKGGSDRTRLKNAALQVVVDDLMKNALYCQGEARHDLNALLSSGYDVASTNRTPAPLDQPAIISIANDVSGQLTVCGQGVVNGRMYQMRTSTDGGKTWTLWPGFTGARLMVLEPTVPGTVYLVEFCALGGSTKQGSWSNPVSIMAT